MLTYALMTALVMFVGASTIYGIKIDKEKDSFMSLSDINFLRGFWCIIVVLVHIPAAYQNRIQDMIGSFAYIGVTFFFMTSAYGLKYSMMNKEGYMEHFWKRRLPEILIPALIANAFVITAQAIGKGVSNLSLVNFININNWVKVLLLYYAAFWLIYHIIPKLTRGGYWQDIVMCLFVLNCSLLERFTSLNINYGWVVEPFGFAYGILAADHSDSIRKWMKEKWLMKSGIFLVLSGFLGIAYLKLKPIPVFGDYLLKIVLGIAITAFMFEVMAKLTVGNRINSFLGNISYEIYLLHGGVFALIATIDLNMDSGIFVITSVMLTIITASVLNRFCRLIVKLFR